MIRMLPTARAGLLAAAAGSFAAAAATSGQFEHRETVKGVEIRTTQPPRLFESSTQYSHLDR